MAECCCPTAVSSCDYGGGIDCDASLQQIVRMVVHQNDPAEVLEALCRLLGGDDKNQPIAFFLMDDDRWTIAAKGRLVPRTEATLNRIDPAQLSQALFQAGASAPERSARPFEAGWARHLFSGLGELLGIVVGLAEGPLLPFGPHASRIESACHLATLAIEQRNLLAELASQTGRDAVARLSRNSDYGELSMQRVTQMIARQCAPREILEALCQHAGEAREEQQVAFFLNDGEEWALAAKGDLTAKAEAALASIDPARLSEALFQPSACIADRTEFPFDHGWARHLFSGTGELLGMLVGLADGPILPSGSLAVRVESICRLATLALEQRNLVEELAFKAEHDSLTGLYNRAYYERMLSSTLQEGRRTGRRAALLYINLDRFRLVNDVLGHATGDRLLDRIGRRFRSGLRAEDALARVGGDEFAVLVADAPAIEDAGAVAGHLLRSLAEPFSVDGHELFIGASIGIAWAAPESTPESLERQAQLALSRAKQAGKARLVYFHSSMAATPPERLEMEKQHFLPRQCETQPLLHFQPLGRRGRHGGMEVHQPRLTGLLGPAESELGLSLQRFRRALRRRPGDSDAGADEQFVAVNRERLRERTQQVPGHGAGILDSRGIGHQDGELVSPDSRQRVLGAQSVSETTANPIQQTVPSSVSQNVIHQPKTVQVDVEQCCPPAGPAALLQGRAQHSLVISAVVQPGEGVVLGLERQFLHQVALL